MTTDPRLADVLQRCAELQRRGQAFTPEELCGGCPELLDALRAHLGSQSATQTNDASPGRDHSIPDTVAPDAVPQGETAWERVGRYTLYGEIARGGMGAVLRAHDDCLNRELAVKVLHSAYRDTATVVRRFTDEAHIGGQLQHPGIVPVYDLGTLPDGRPFFAMKLVKGRTLAELLRERPDPAHERPRFLKIFEQICQTIAYAHSRRVLHRDLKPANVMVGAFGEVQVMDWGIAKVLGKEPLKPSAPPTEVLPQTEIHSNRSDTPALETQAGAVLGTYAYMAPEQARGQADQLDERCDVFGLGAILCEILTGRPPYSGTIGEQLRVQSLVADQAGALARLAGSGADSELVALTRNCLEAEPARRPRDAGVVAAAVTAYLAGVEERLRQAEVDRAAAQVKAAEERKRRRLTLVLAAALLLTVLAGGGAYTIVRQQRQARQEQTAVLLNQALGQASALHKQARVAPIDEPGQRERAAALWRDALAAADRAEQALGSGPVAAETRAHAETLLAELRAEAEAAEKDRRMLTRLEHARDLAGEIQESDYVRRRRVEEFIFGSAAAPAYAAAFREYGIDVEALSTAEAARRIRAAAIRQRLAVALDDWYLVDPRAVGGRLLEVARAADADPLRDRVRVAVAREDRKALKELAGDAEADALPSPTLLLLADVLHQQGLRAEAIDLLKRARLRYPHDFWVNDVLGLHFEAADPPNYAEAARCFAAAVALRPRSPVGWSNLGTVLTIQGRLAEALPLLRECVRLSPDFPTGYERLCGCLVELRKSDEALAVVHEGLRRRPQSPMLLTALANVQSAQGKRDEAIATVEKVLGRNPEWIPARLRLAMYLSEAGRKDEALKQLAEAQRSHPEFSHVHSMRGIVLSNSGDLKGALAAYRKAVALGPADLYGWSGLGRVLTALRRYDEALEAHGRAIDMAPGNASLRVARAEALRARGLREEAVAECRTALRLNPRFAYAHALLGWILHDQGKYAAAAASLRAAVHLDPNPALYDHLGEALRLGKDYEEAAAAYGEALRLQPDNSSFHNHLGHVYYNQRRYAEAVPHYRAAVARKPRDAGLHHNLGNALRHAGKLADGIASLRTAARLNPLSGPIQSDLALALWQSGDYEESSKVGRAAVWLQPQSALAHNALGLSLERKGLLDEAIMQYREAARLSPRDAVMHSNLGSALRRKGRYEEAILVFREAVRLQPGFAQYYSRLGDALLDTARYADAVAAYRKAIELEPASAVHHTALAAALNRQRSYREAEAAARKAIELDPKRFGGYRVLGHVFFNQNRLEEAAAHYRKAIALAPDFAALHEELGKTFLWQRKDAEAEAALRRAVELDGKSAVSHTSLGIALLRQGRAAAAEAELRRAILLAPRLVAAHSRLSEALLQQGKLAEAVTAARQALRLLPDNARSHFRLGEALAAHGEFAESLAAFRRARELRTPAMDAFEPLPWDERVRKGERLLELDATLTGLRRGKLKVADAGELAAVAEFCHRHKRQPATAVRLYAEVFTAAPKLADDLAAGHRFIAACAAARAAATEKGTGVGAAEAKRLRGQALDWLRAELAAWSEHVKKGPFVVRATAWQRLLHWQQHPDLARLREPGAIAGLPEPERAAWKHLWAEVAVLLGGTTGDRSGR